MAKPRPAPDRIAVSVKTAAHVLDCSVRTIYRLLAEGVLKGFKLRAGTRVTMASIQSYVAKGGSQ